MRVRSRITGAPLAAELRLYRQSGQRRFVLVLREPDGRRVPVGRLTAAIGYQLVDAAARERAALTLAGFQLPEAGQRRDLSERLTRVLRDTQGEKRQTAARGPHFQPVPASGRTKAIRSPDQRTAKGTACVFRK